MSKFLFLHQYICNLSRIVLKKLFYITSKLNLSIGLLQKHQLPTSSSNHNNHRATPIESPFNDHKSSNHTPMPPKTELLTDDGQLAKSDIGDSDETADKMPPFNPYREKATPTPGAGPRDRYAAPLVNPLMLNRRDDLNMLLGFADDFAISSENGVSRMSGKRSGIGMQSLDFGFDLFDERLSSGDPAVHPLFEHGVCKWPGCEVGIADLGAFVR